MIGNLVTRCQHSHPLLGALVLTTGLLAGSLAPQPAHAAISTCRTDPIVTLSNGYKVQMSNSIADTATNVTKVTYTLHGPTGTTVKSVVYPTDNTSSIPETFQYVADTQLGDYDSYSVTYDANAGVNISAYTTVTNTVGTSLSLTAQGHPGQQIHIHVHLT